MALSAFLLVMFSSGSTENTERILVRGSEFDAPEIDGVYESSGFWDGVVRFKRIGEDGADVYIFRYVMMFP